MLKEPAPHATSSGRAKSLTSIKCRVLENGLRVSKFTSRSQLPDLYQKQSGKANSNPCTPKPCRPQEPLTARGVRKGIDKRPLEGDCMIMIMGFCHIPMKTIAPNICSIHISVLEPPESGPGLTRRNSGGIASGDVLVHSKVMSAMSVRTGGFPR
jgi:hypothetical protein